MYIKGPFNINGSGESLIQGSINGCFFAGGLFGTLLAKFLTNTAHTKIFIATDLLMIIGIFGSAITNVPA